MIKKTNMLKKSIKRKIREDKSLNQKVIAARVGITDAYLSQLLDGKREGSYDLISSIADAAGLQVDNGNKNAGNRSVELKSGGELELEKMLYQLIKEVGVLTSNCDQVKDMLTNIERDVNELKKAAGPHWERATRRSEAG